MKRLSAIYLALLSLSAVITSGCNTSGCTENQSALPLAGFYDSASGLPVSLSGISIHGIGAPGDSILLEPSRTATEVYLPFRAAQAMTQYCIAYPGHPGLDIEEMNDTVTWVYSSLPYFVSEECGASYRYSISMMEYTTHALDSVVILDSLITNVNLERIRFYFKTEHPEEE